jgi:hypothetical protein
MSSLPTSNERSERRRFFQEYNDLASTLALFHDPDGKTDAELIDRYLAEEYPSALPSLLAEGHRFLSQHELPMELIADTANRCLMTEAEQRQWLQTLLDRVQAELEARRVTPHSG